MQLKESTKRRKCRTVAGIAEGTLTLCFKAVSLDWDQIDVLMWDDGDTHIPQELIDFAVDHGCQIKLDDAYAEQGGKKLIIYNLVPADKKGGFRV